MGIRRLIPYAVGTTILAGIAGAVVYVEASKEPSGSNVAVVSGTVSLPPVPLPTSSVLSALPENPAQSGLAPSPMTFIDNATIVDPRDGSLRSGMTIAMKAGKIERIMPTPDTLGEAGQHVDVTGKFVVPGYNNMHSHELGPKDPSGAMALALAEGVTGFRQMSSSTALAQQRRAGTLPLNVNTPSLLTMGSPVLSPFNAGSDTAASMTIAKAKSEGADFIKIAAVRPDVFYYALSEAKRVGLPALGHLQNGVDALRASREGMRSIEHLGPTEPIWIACSRDKEALLTESAAHPP